MLSEVLTSEPEETALMSRVEEEDEEEEEEKEVVVLVE